MELSPENVNSQSVLSDNDKLIQAIESCFSKMLEKQEEQAKQYVMVLSTYYSPQWSPRLQQAVEGLKPKIPVTDKKTNFWNLYKTLADEYDREFQQKYSTDLDTALIFIQPEITPHYTAPTILVAQSLLYISLGSTLLAALLAVLGKQWLMYYMAGERGTLEARGLERQRKFDGLRKWKFDAVMQMFPLLLQFGLFLFAAGLSVYLWTSHVSLAIIALVMTSLGSMAYITLLLSAVFSPDSPFQTPLAPLLVRLVPMTLWIKLKAFSTRITGRSLQLIGHAYLACSGYLHCSQALLPYFTKPRGPENTGRSNKMEPNPLFDVSLLVPSIEVPAVSWVLETSTDPLVVAAASELVVELQWPVRMDVRPQLTRLRDNLLMCFEHYNSGMMNIYCREGMSLPALHLGRAYCSLCSVYSWNLDNDPEPHFEWLPIPAEISPELANTIQILTGKPSIIFNVEAMKWALHNIPSLQHLHGRNLESLQYFLNQSKAILELDRLGFTDYLFCVTSFLVPVSTSDMVWMDKSQFQHKLFEHFLQTLISSLKKGMISMNTVAKIIDIAGQIVTTLKNTVWDWDSSGLRRIVYRFCDSLPHSEGWINVILGTGHFTEGLHYPRPYYKVGTVVWVEKALAQIPIPSEDAPWDSRTTAGVTSLLEALLYYNCAPAKESIHVILHALSIPGWSSSNAATVLLAGTVRAWYQDDDLRLILQNESLWSSLSDTVLKGLSETNATQSLGLSFITLSKFWEEFDFETGRSLLNCIKWLKCTCQVALQTGYIDKWQDVPLTSCFKEAFSDRLCAALTHAAIAARQRITAGSSNDSDEIYLGIEESIANVLEEIARRIPKSTDPDPEENGDEESIYRQVKEEIDVLEEKAMSVFVQ
ncbi:hypothetical protein DFH07DRAFT_980440 [Mycena maculata]|uniref:DUF6535 domain-containing protein n=1 Tax=Mycena maculata TaxID=230809 RepID=A0AAD7N1Y2_9AGAR|nr:hypothetical protein DFH07DRAFT_980440 [Mycena maculata]